jgi:hypothetical protein
LAIGDRRIGDWVLSAVKAGQAPLSLTKDLPKEVFSLVVNESAFTIAEP